MNTCHGCGTEKDPNVLEVYPYPEDDDICEDPIPPFWTFSRRAVVGGGRQPSAMSVFTGWSRTCGSTRGCGRV
jgi:hypothetical protein